MSFTRHRRVPRDGHPAVLAQLDRVSAADLEEIIVEAWLARAPRKLAERYVASRTEG